MPTRTRDAAEAIVRLGNFPPDGALTGYLVEALGGQTVKDRAVGLTQALDYLGVLGPIMHPPPKVGGV